MAKQYRLGIFRRLINRVVTRRVTAGKSVGADVRLLTTTGRRSGLPRTTPVTIVEVEGEEWLVAPYGSVSWVHNIRANPRASFTKGSATTSFTAVEVSPEEAAPVLHRYVTEVKVVRPFFDASHDGPAEAFASEPDKPVFRIDGAG